MHIEPTTLQMSSAEKVIDLKLKIYEQLKQSPNDQLLYADEVPLENEQTLEEAKIEAENTSKPLILIVQQTINDSSSTTGESRQMEKGFRDTALSLS